MTTTVIIKYCHSTYYVLDTVLIALHIVNLLNLVFEIGFISPILQLRKLRHREVK